MSYYEYNRRHELRTIEDVDREIDLLRLRHQQTCDPVTRRDCQEKLAICAALRADLQQLELFTEPAA